MSRQYHKLVRDKIPKIIEATGKSCKTEISDDATYLQLLDDKLTEELAEYQQSKALEELADLLEVMEAVVTARGESWEQLIAIKEQKKAARGGFADKILLLEVTESKPPAK